MHKDSGEARELGTGIIARYTCGCSVVRDFDGREYQQPSLLCAGGSEHGRRIEDPTRQNAHLWRPSLPFPDADEGDAGPTEEKSSSEGVRTYEERVQRRRARLESAAARERAKARQCFEASDRAVEGIPFGQPILVGHHSERRHRRALERARSRASEGLEHSDRAAELERSARRVGSGGVSSDDEDAIGKLEAKLADLGAQRVRLKRANQAIRAGTPEDKIELTDREREDLRGLGTYTWERAANGRAIFPGYVFRNLGGRIRQVEQRLHALRAAEVKREEASSVELASGAGCTATEDRENNRIVLTFAEKPSATVRGVLKAGGYRWSPSRSAWVRKLTDAARADLPATLERVRSAGV
jgi:hypothetical protein